VRIDLLLKNILVFKKRNTAKMLCENNLIKVNGHVSKASKKIQEGDIIEIETSDGIRKFKILKIPRGNIRKQDSGLYYQELSL
jgi:ribosomal 50S subunit-recycling heat shock protein